MSRYERTTRKPTMVKSVMHARIGGQSELLAIGEKSYSSIDDFCDEISYWFSCYYESGHYRHKEEYKDRKAFLKYLEVFKPHCKEKHTKWIPYIEETKFLFD